MTPPDPRDAALAETVGSVVGALVLAVDRGDTLAVAAQMQRLLVAVIEFRGALSERPGDEALRRAVRRGG